MKTTQRTPFSWAVIAAVWIAVFSVTPFQTSAASLVVPAGQVVTNDLVRTSVSGTNVVGANELWVKAANGFAPNDWVLVIITQDAETNLTQNTSGQYEFANILGINGNRFTLSRPLTNSYIATNKAIQVLRVPVYDSVTVEGTLTCSAWNGTNGGVLALLCRGNLTVSSNGVIHANGKGFRGGKESGVSPDVGGGFGFAGEGAVRYPLQQATNSMPEPLGGGGSPYWLNSAGGGGGYGTKGEDRGGFGALAFGASSLERLYSGGGGGSGGVSIFSGGGGGNGGGIVVIRALAISGGGQIAAKGDNGIDGHIWNGDGSSGGGGGAGGSIFISTALSDTDLMLLCPGGLGGIRAFPRLQDGGAGGNGRIRIDQMNASIPAAIPSIGFSKLTVTSALRGLESFDGDVDIDQDGIPDYWENAFNLNPTNALDATFDADSDGFNNIWEYELGLSPVSSDTDGDSLTDYAELFVHDSDPLSTNSSGDGIPDGWKVQYGLNPAVANATEGIGSSGVTYLQVYQYNLGHTNQLDPRNPFPASSASLYEAINSGQITNKFTVDRNDRLRGMESSRGVSLAYVYDGNDNLIGQAVLSRASETNGLPVLWRYLNGLTNSTNPYADSDGDGWTDYQEWLAGSSPTNAFSTPNVLGNPGTNIASLVLPFTPSNFVVGVGQLDGSGAEEMVIGADGNSGTNNNFMLVLTQQGFASWSTQRVDVGTSGITSIAVGQVTNRPSTAIYVGLRGATNGSGRVMEFVSTGGIWQSNVVAFSTNETAFVLGVRGLDLLLSRTDSNSVVGSLQSATFSDSWSISVLSTNASNRGLGTKAVLDAKSKSTGSLRVLDTGGVEIGGLSPSSPPTNQGLIAWSPFHGNTDDLSGNGHNGTNSGAVMTADRYNNLNEAYYFNGTNSWIGLPGLSFANQSFSIVAWIQRQLAPSPAGICFGYGDFSGNDVERRLHIGFRSADTFTFAFYADDLDISPFTDFDQWHHWVMSFDALTRSRRIYRDGVLVGSDVAAQAFQGIGTYFCIGKSSSDSAFFRGVIDEVGVFNRALTAQEAAHLASQISITSLNIPEPSAIRNLLPLGIPFDAGSLRPSITNAVSVCYASVDDKNQNDRIDSGDDFIVTEHLLAGTNTSLLTLSRRRVASATAGQSYGLTCVKFLNASNELFFIGEPDGQVFAWTATGTNPLQRQLFSAHHLGKGWHAFAGVKTLSPGEGLAGLRIDPASPNRCDVIFWEPQFTLPEIASLPQTAPAAVVLPSTNTLGSQAFVSIRLWDAEGNAATPFLQYQVSGSTNWLDATLTTLNGVAYATANKVPASPGGVNHSVVWNAQADLGANVVTNVLLRVRAQDFSLLGDWSIGTPFQVNMGASQDSDGDGIPDSWELAQFGNLSHGAATDTDGDGMGDYAEYIADTNPTNAASNLRITSAQPIPGGFVLNWQGGSAATQFVQREFGPFSNLWQNIWTSLPPTPVSGSYTDGIVTNGPVLFRLQVTR